MTKRSENTGTLRASTQEVWGRCIRAAASSKSLGDIGTHWGNITGFLVRLDGDRGKENGNYYDGLNRVKGYGFRLRIYAGGVVYTTRYWFLVQIPSHKYWNIPHL